MANRQDLIDFWRQLPADGFVHPADQPVLASRRHHLKVDHVPVPWWGALQTARVFLLYLNPGFNEVTDIETAGDDVMPKLRRRRLSGEDVEGEVLAHHHALGSGFEAWFTNKLKGVCQSTAIERDLCALNLVAYKSKAFRDHPLVKLLPSSQLIRQVVADEIAPLARAGDAMLVVVRQTRRWGFTAADQRPTLWVLSPGQARGGHVTAKTAHGQAVRDFLAQRR